MTRACERLIIAIINPHHDAHCRLPNLFRQGYKLIVCISVARVQPRTSKDITDLSWPQTSLRVTHTVPLRNNQIRITPETFSRLRSRSLTELTRQINEPTENGTAPQHIESRKSYQSVIKHNDDNTKDKDDDTTRHNTTQRRTGTSHSNHHTKPQPPRQPPPQPTTKNKQQPTTNHDQTTATATAAAEHRTRAKRQCPAKETSGKRDRQRATEQDRTGQETFLKYHRGKKKAKITLFSRANSWLS